MILTRSSTSTEQKLTNDSTASTNRLINTSKKSRVASTKIRAIYDTYRTLREELIRLNIPRAEVGHAIGVDKFTYKGRCKYDEKNLLRQMGINPSDYKPASQLKRYAKKNVIPYSRSMPTKDRLLIDTINRIECLELDRAHRLEQLSDLIRLGSKGDIYLHNHLTTQIETIDNDILEYKASYENIKDSTEESLDMTDELV